LHSRLTEGIRRFTSRAFTAGAVIVSLYLLFFVREPKATFPGRTVIDLWHVRGQDETDPQAPQWFNEEQDAFYVNVVGVPFIEIERKFLTSIVGNVPPDLFEYFGSVAQWSSRGALLPLDEYMERDGFDRSKIFEALWDEVSWEGQVYAIPVGTACDVFYWNKQHFREAGLDPQRPPRTWAELEDYAERLTVRSPDGRMVRAGYIPGYWSPAKESYTFIFWAMQKGARFVSPDGRKVNLTSPACVEALEWEGKLFEKLGRNELIRLRASFGYGAQHGFFSGQVSMIGHKSSLVVEQMKFAPNLEYGASLFPIPEGGRPATTSGAVWIAIPAGAEHPDEAWEYIKYLTQTPVQQRAADYTVDQNIPSFLPSNIEVARSPKQMSVPHNEVFVESMKWARSPTIVPLAHSVFWREYGSAWDRVMRGLQAPLEALSDAEREIQRALDDQLEYYDYYQRHRSS